MTALTRYARLETTGFWRPDAEGEAVEVAVSLGDATLVMTDFAGNPVAHWSLPAVTRLNPGAQPARFAPDEAGTESIEIEDDLMVSAIETVRRHVARTRPGSRRVRRAVVAGALAFAVGLGLLWAPGALRREALSVVPPAKRSEIGATILGHLSRDLGAACRDPVGAEALRRLHARLFGEGAPGQIVVLPLGPAEPLALPGGLVVLPRAIVERAAEPAALAGHVLAARAAAGDPLGGVLDGAGPFATLRLLATGGFAPGVLEAHAGRLREAPPAPPPPEALAPVLLGAGVPPGPYARDIDPGAAVAPDPDPARAPLLTDAEWVSLQEICGGA
jgi:hypothetical protein